MKTINKIICASALGLALLCGTGCDNKTAFLKNPKNVKSHKIPDGAMYLLYAAELRDNCPKLSKMNLQDISYFIKHDLNKGRELYAGKEVRLPEYDCE
ncbi:MAG: hypothetical protein ABIB79_05365 [archaeon]